MEKNRRNSKDLAIWKWLVLFAVVFTLVLPVSAKPCKASSPDTYCVSVSSGYLALRAGKSYSSNNEIGQLYSGDMVTVSDYSDSTYWYVYSSKYNQYGYVNKNYLVYNGSAAATASVYTVSVSKGYLALRSDSSYNPANEIGELYSGDTVEVQNATGAYWYVYSYKLGQYGYVDKAYLVSGGAAGGYAGSSDTRTVSVSKGYLALRSAKSYNDSNEIGKLYNEDTVQLLDTSDSTYWYVYSAKLGMNGYVNKNYLSGGSSYPSKTVSVTKGYLALRSAKAYNDANEIGKLYSGDTVELLDTSDSTYWYVYAPSLGENGYVNKTYLY